MIYFTLKLFENWPDICISSCTFIKLEDEQVFTLDNNRRKILLINNCLQFKASSFLFKMRFLRVHNKIIRKSVYELVKVSIILQYSCLENPMDREAWWAAVHGVAKGRTRLSNFTFTFHFHALEKEMATHSSVLAWRIPGMGEPGGLPSMGSHRVGHN